MPSHVGYGRKVGGGSDRENMQETDELGQYTEGSTNPESDRTEEGRNEVPQREDFKTRLEWLKAMAEWKRSQKPSTPPQPEPSPDSDPKTETKEVKQPERNVPSPTIKNVLSSIAGAKWDSEELNKNIDAYSKMPEGFRNTFENVLAKGLKIKKSRKAYFMRVGNEISLSDESFFGSNTRTSGDIFVHEAGHAVDNELSNVLSGNSYGFASLNYKSKKYGVSLWEMAKTELADDSAGEFGYLSEKITQSINQDKSNDPEWAELSAKKRMYDEEKAELVKRNEEKYRREIAKFISLYPDKVENKEKLEPFLDALNNQEITRQEIDNMAYELFKKPLEKNSMYSFVSNNSFYYGGYGEFKRKLLRELQNEREEILRENYGNIALDYSMKELYFSNRASQKFNQMTDLWGATRRFKKNRSAQKADCPVRSGHNSSYMNDDENCATELFADLSAVIAIGGESYAIMEERAPKTLEIYREMLQEYGKRTGGENNG